MTIRLVLALLLALRVVADAQQPAGRWVTAWTTSQQALGSTAISNATVRLIPRVTIPGDAVRIRLDNTYGTVPVQIGRAHVGWRRQGASIFPGSNRPVLFKGNPGVTIPAGGSVLSDAIALKVVA